MNAGSLIGKNALVTGAGSGIGRQVAVALAAEGARVVLAGRRAAELRLTGAEIENLGGSHLVVETDITNEADVKALLVEGLTGQDRLDIAVNGAGVFRAGAIDEMQLDRGEAFSKTAMKTGKLSTKRFLIRPVRVARSDGESRIVALAHAKAGRESLERHAV